MEVNSTNSSLQMQMQKMDGSGSGQGQGGMKDIMQNLSTEDRNTIKGQMSSMSPEEKASMVEQMKQVDQSSMSSQDYTQTLLDLLDQSTTENSSQDNLLSVYA